LADFRMRSTKTLSSQDLAVEANLMPGAISRAMNLPPASRGP
jgi:hypothetical protein